MPVCIAGMPHSGLALVSRLLGRIGLDLGPPGEELPSPDGEGRFAKLNDEILHAVGAAWDSPPQRDSEWARASQLETLRQGAAELATALGLSEPWGWADPRNSLTLPFWRDLFPDLRLLVCVRDPREVVGALEAAGVISRQEAFRLWEEYYQALLDAAGDACVITHYDSYRDDSKAELQRLARGFGLDGSRIGTAWAAAEVRAPSAAGDPDGGPLPRRLEQLYDRLVAAASAPPPEAGRAQGTPPARAARVREDLAEPVKAQRRELEHLRLELARARGYIDALRAQVEVRSHEPEELRAIAVNLEQQLLERDEELEKLRAALSEGNDWRLEMEAAARQTELARQEAEEWLRQENDGLRGEIELMKSTRLWRTGERYRALREGLQRLLSRPRR